MRITTSLFLSMAAAATLSAQRPDPPGQAKGAPPKCPAYLFGHMTQGDYGSLYYSVSLDGLHWNRLNGGKRASTELRTATPKYFREAREFYTRKLVEAERGLR